MMMATGADMAARFSKKGERQGLQERPPAGQWLWGLVGIMVNARPGVAPVFAGRERRSGDDVRGDLVFEEGNPVAQLQLAFFQPLQLQQVRRGRMVQSLDCGIKVTMLLLQPGQLEGEFVIVLFGHDYRRLAGLRSAACYLHGRKGRAVPAFGIFRPHFLQCNPFRFPDRKKFECVALIPVDRSQLRCTIFRSTLYLTSTEEGDF